jgi:hypothetical protein
MKGCCFSYQLNGTINTNSYDSEFDQQEIIRIRRLCNSFGDYENHYEAVCEGMCSPIINEMHIWKENDTMSRHYMSVARNLQYLSDESRKKKHMACLEYLSDPNPELWFPHSDTACS